MYLDVPDQPKKHAPAHLAHALGGPDGLFGAPDPDFAPDESMYEYEYLVQMIWRRIVARVPGAGGTSSVRSVLLHDAFRLSRMVRANHEGSQMGHGEGI